MIEILYAIIILAAIGLVCGIGLSLASKYFSEAPDEKLEAIRGALPGANCGACGYAGCDDYAAAVKDGTAEPNKCIPGGKETADSLSEILGVEVKEIKLVARAKCMGDCEHSSTKYDYNGVMSCSAAATIFDGPMTCPFSCIGMGDCVKVCDFGAINVIDGLVRVDKDLCAGCSKCVSACPKKILTMVKATDSKFVACSNTDKGAKTMKVCSVGCIGCSKCVKECEFDAITVENFLARIDSEKCTNCGKCAEVCPRKCII